MHSENEAFRLKNNINGFIQNELLPRIEAIFDQYITKNQIARFDNLDLEIDLKNNIDYATLNNEVCRQIQEFFDKNIAKFNGITKSGEHSPKPKILIKGTTVQNSIEESFLYFLKNGTLPWYATHNHFADLIKPGFISKCLSNKLFSTKLIDVLSGDDDCLERIILQFDNNFLFEILISINKKTIALQKQVLQLLNKGNSQFRNLILKILFIVSVEAINSTRVVKVKHSIQNFKLNSNVEFWLVKKNIITLINIVAVAGLLDDESKMILISKINVTTELKREENILNSESQSENQFEPEIKTAPIENKSDSGMNVKEKYKSEFKQKDSSEKLITDQKKQNEKIIRKKSISESFELSISNQRENLENEKKLKIAKDLLDDRKQSKISKTESVPDSLRENNSENSSTTQNENTDQANSISELHMQELKKHIPESVISQSEHYSEIVPEINHSEDEIETPTISQNKEIEWVDNDLNIKKVIARNVDFPIFPEKEIFIENAGLILFHPFLKHFFKQIDVLNQEDCPAFHKRSIAVKSLHYLATFNENIPEYKLVFEKFLCGIPHNFPIEKEGILTGKIKNEANELLMSTVNHWTALKNTSPEGLQQLFIQREGKLIQNDENFKLIIERKAQDVLLEMLPWNLSMIKLPWITGFISVEW